MGFNQSSTELLVNWDPIQQQHVNGILKGYTVYYAVHSSPTDDWMSEDVQNTFASLTNLSKFTQYRIQVAAFTVKGHGPMSEEIILQTSEDGTWLKGEWKDKVWNQENLLKGKWL